MMTEDHPGIAQEKEHDFPYAASEVKFDSTTDGCAHWHWHNHFEFGMVESGRMLLGIHNESFTLESGDGYFINSNVLHYCCAADGERDVHVQMQMFDRNLIAGTGKIGKRYVAPLENCMGMEVYVLRSAEREHTAILQDISSAFCNGLRMEEGFELQVYAHISLAWSRLYKLAEPLFLQEKAAKPENTARARMMLGYIHQHYAEPVTIRQIAAHTGVCERECFRSFSQYFNTTPMDYLIRYRISVAARKLIETDAPIFQIGSECGFASSSYFSLVFRQIMGKSPREYRKENA